MDLNTLVFLLFTPVSAVNAFAIFYSNHKNKKTGIYLKQLKDRLNEISEGIKDTQNKITEVKKSHVKQANISELEKKLNEATAELLYSKKKMRSKQIV
ncbi:MAG: hypothetical protein ABH803_02905 [Candidatus Micrarchaeota archaeon]